MWPILAKRPLQMGHRLAGVPGTRSAEMIELLIQYNSKLVACPAQKFAIEERDAQLLSYLFRAWGNLVPVDELGESVIHIINKCDIDMLGVLVSLTVFTWCFVSIRAKM